MFVCPPPLFPSLLRAHRRMIHITASSLFSHQLPVLHPWSQNVPPCILQLTHVLFCLSNMSYCIDYSYIFVYISCFSSHPSFICLSSVFIVISLFLSLYLLSFCVAQSLLVPGKSPSKYGRRGSAIGIGTVEEVHVSIFFCFFLPLFDCILPAHLSLFEDIQQTLYSMMPFVIFALYSVNKW